MDFDTIILIFLLAAAICWWCVMHIQEERQSIRRCDKEREESRVRAERVRRLTNKSSGGQGSS